MIDYTKYFPLKTTSQVAGAYDFLVSEGYDKEVECIKRIGYNSNTRRIMVVGLLYDKGLNKIFLNLIWTMGDPKHHQDFMDKYYKRYRKREELHVCWK
ncbi:hypothetical protein ACFLVN_02025 [Chloroflexota bacterium]